MFANHQPLIGAYARQSPEAFADVGLFVLLSIRERFPTVRRMFREVKSGNHAALYGWKSEAYAMHVREAPERLARLEDLVTFHNRPRGCVNALRVTENHLLAETASWYGFGLVKGGFFLQLVYGLSGCIDVRNADSFGIPDKDIGLAKPRLWRTQYRKVNKYNGLCRSLGGTASLWDFWCRGYAETYRGEREDLRTPYDFSEEHCRILGIATPTTETTEEAPF